MPAAAPVRLLILGPPGTAGDRALLARARAAHEAGRPVDVLLTGRGLAWRDDAELARLAAEGAVTVGLCSRSARAQGLDAAAIPPWIRWTSLVAFFTALEPDAALWGLLP